MASQESIILNILVKQLHEERASSMSLDKYFELFINEQVLKEYDLSYEELRAGNIGNGGDGGIDGLFLFVNETLIQSDTDLNIFKKNINIDLHIIQTKNTDSFDESVIEKFILSAEDFFHLDKSIDSLRSVYNSDFIRQMELFRNTYIYFLSKQPNLSIHYYYASKGDEIHPNVERKIITLESTVKKYFHASNFSFEFMKADKILALSRSTKKQIFKLQLSESPIATQEGGYVCLVNLDDYYNFIIDEQEQIIKYIFDANVRDYQKNTTVNKEIGESLKSSNPEDFWWLNNGITILSDSVKLSGKILTIQDPQIVNGCQTSFEIFNYKSSHGVENRNLLVRVIETDDDNVKSRIIKSTNSQTQIPAASLRSTDPIHRNIEQFFQTYNLFYDRRRNYWKNQGKPISSIVTIPFLSQTIMAMLMQHPELSRAKPSMLVNDDAEYNNIFNDRYPLITYLNAINLQRKIEAKLTSTTILNKGEGLNIRWFTSLYLILKRLSLPVKPANNFLRQVEKFNSIDFESITDADIDDSIMIVRDVFRSLGGNDGVAKAKYFTDKIFEIVNGTQDKILF